jgi:2-dehydro-3-deoxygluconokinase
MRRLGFFGEVMQEFRSVAALEVVPPAPVRFAGDTFNTACYLQRLLQQRSGTQLSTEPSSLSVHYFTAIGQDALSSAFLAACQQDGVQLHGQPNPTKTLGSYSINTDAQGERSFSYQRSDSAVRAYFAQAQTELEQALAKNQLALLYVSGISLAVLPEAGRERLYDAIAGFVGRGGTLVYDNNFRPLLWDAATAARWQAKLLPLAALALLTDADERLIWQQPSASAGQLLQHARQYLAADTVCLLKCGAAPALVSLGQWQTAVPALEVAAVLDTSGAGDAFAAAFIWAWLQQGALQRPLPAGALKAAAQAGHQLAAAVVQQPGAIVARIPEITIKPASPDETGSVYCREEPDVAVFNITE